MSFQAKERIFRLEAAAIMLAVAAVAFGIAVVHSQEVPSCRVLTAMCDRVGDLSP
jgi:EamA domain-containing membrane protein RarD